MAKLSETRVKKAICMWCHDHCRVEVHIRDGGLLKFEEDKEHPRSAVLKPTVRACPRARAAAEWFHHPDRLSYPLKRAGERGEGKWQRISWEKALERVRIAGSFSALHSPFSSSSLFLFRFAQG